MDRLTILNKRQQEAVDSWNGIGTINAAVGFGKNFTAFKCINKAYSKGWINKGDSIWFFAETNARESTLWEELSKFKKLTKVDLKKLFKWSFHCYQSLPVGDRHLDVYDEIHDALTPKFKVNIENGASFKIGLSATIPKNSNLYKNDLAYNEINSVYQTKEELLEGNDIRINKGQLLDQLCPICYVYSLSKGIEEGILAPFQTTIIEHALDKNIKNIKVWKSKPGLGSELDYYTKRANLKSIWSLPFYRKQTLGKEMSQFLWELPSKVQIVKNLIKTLDGKTIIFGTRLNHLKLITSNVVEGKGYQDLIDKFNNEEIDIIASSKKLKQGITLKGVKNCIIVSYFSTFNDVVQQLGRIVRYSEGKIANLYIIVTLNTFEEKWLESMQKIYDEKGKLESELNLNIKYYISSKTYLINE